MLRYIFLAITFLVLGSIAIALIISVLTVLALMAVVGIPLYLLARKHMGQRGIGVSAQNRIERLQQLYAEGKIDMFEFERKVARLISFES